jgi:hypothetical protein
MNFGLYTVRDNQLANVVRTAVIQNVAADLRSDIHLGIAAEQEGISERLRVLKPDMVFDDEMWNSVNQWPEETTEENARRWKKPVTI